VRRYRRRWWRFGLSDPGASLAGCAIIGHHRDRNIARSGLGSPEGEAHVRHFEVHGPAPAFDAATKAPFLIRETRSQIVAASAPSRPRAIISSTSKPETPARAVWTSPPATAGGGSFSFVAFQPDKPKDPKKQLFEAVWTGMQL
jgi:hypothetical protein